MTTTLTATTAAAGHKPSKGKAPQCAFEILMCIRDDVLIRDDLMRMDFEAIK